MSKELAIQSINLVKQQEPKFRQLDKANGNLLDFERECLFARQQLLKNDFTLKIAASNPNSLQGAILNVAAIGISLNPAQQHAYLVPRDGAICLDISFRGLTYLATESGAIKWAKVELVYEADTFAWRGPAEMPLHEADPFSERGEIKGGYCIAKLPDDSVMVEVMPVAEIYKIRNTSKAYQAKKGPWFDYEEEMMKKTILKRASKS
jgi:recombination protein RecT